MTEIWLGDTQANEMIAEANRRYPKETGGILMGYPLPENHGAVITHVVGPGQRAKHHANRFVPDAEHQQEQIDSIYAATNGCCTYLGDWHTHPDGCHRLSVLDRLTLWRISRTRAARCAEPYMLIWADRPGRWQPAVFRRELADRSLCVRLAGKPHNVHMIRFSRLPERYAITSTYRF